MFRVSRDFRDANALLNRYNQWNHTTTADIQLSRLRERWRDCIEDVPYYSSLVASGDAPQEIRSWDDFRSIPVLTRQIIQDRKNEFQRKSGPPDLTRMTGGSTGNPVHFGVWKEEDRTVRLLKLTLWLRAGYQKGHRLFLIWGHSHLLGTGWKRYLNQLKRKWKDAILRYRRVDAYVLDAQRCHAFAEDLIRFKPAGLIGYAAALDAFVRANIGLSDKFRSLNLQFVMPCAEPPPNPDTFDLFRSTFNCTVIQEFGGVDFGQVASQFDREPFFVFPDQNILETESDSENGMNEFSVLVTSLYRRYFPLVRYRQGDAISGVEYDPHGHVRSFANLSGRVNDMIRLNSGTEVHSVGLFHCVHQEAAIHNIQLILEDAGPRLLLATATGQLPPEVEKRVRHRLGQLDQQLATVPIECAFDVETTRAGKRRWFSDRRTQTE